MEYRLRTRKYEICSIIILKVIYENIKEEFHGLYSNITSFFEELEEELDNLNDEDYEE